MFPQVHVQYALFLCRSSSAMVCLQWSQPLGSYNNKSIYFLEWTPIESHLCLTWVGAPDHTPLTYEIVLSYLHFNTFLYLLVPSSSNTPPWLTQEEFLEKYRIHRDSFHLLVDKIRDHSVFQSLHGKKKQKPVAFQLMVFLFCVGTSGSGSRNPDAQQGPA